MIHHTITETNTNIEYDVVAPYKLSMYEINKAIIAYVEKHGKPENNSLVSIDYHTGERLSPQVHSQ